MTVRKLTRLNIGGQSFKVQFMKHVKSSNDGQYIQGEMSSQEGRISIRNSRPFLEVDTLIHEILHALEYKGGLEHNEYWVNRIATGLAQVFKDNPRLIEFIVQKLKEDEDHGN